MKRLFFPALLSFLLLFSFVPSTFAASVGDVLQEPEEGWTRYDHSSLEITYYGGKWFVSTTGTKSYNSPWQTSGTGLKFNFEGTKIRLISSAWSTGSKDVSVIIDGVEVDRISLYNASGINAQRIMFEKLDLPEGEHSIEFKNNTKEYLFLFGVDADGPLKPFDPTIPDPIDPIDPKPEPSGNRAILSIIMTTGLEKEFDLSMEEVNAFINWYDAKENDVGPARYGLDKHNNNKGPFSKRIDYVIFKNILSFEVNEYSTAISASYLQ